MMVSGGIEFYQCISILFILEAKFGDDPQQRLNSSSVQV